MRYFKAKLAAILLCAFLFNAPVYPADLGTGMGQGIVQLAGISIRQQMLLYLLCGYYHLKNGNWPRDKREFTAFFERMGEDAQKEVIPLLQSFLGEDAAPAGWTTREYLKLLSSVIYYDFTPLNNGDLLIEGGFNKELTKGSSLGRSSFLFSTVAHKTEEGFSFDPSDKAKRNANYLAMPFEFKVAGGDIQLGDAP